VFSGICELLLSLLIIGSEAHINRGSISNIQMWNSFRQWASNKAVNSYAPQEYTYFPNTIFAILNTSLISIFIYCRQNCKVKVSKGKVVPML